MKNLCRAAMAAMLALALTPATSKADDLLIGASVGILIYGVAQALMPPPGNGSQSFDEVREAPKLRARTEVRAGRLGVATEWAMTPRRRLGIWRGAAGEHGAPTTVFFRMRY